MLDLKATNFFGSETLLGLMEASCIGLIQWLTDNGPCYAAHETVTFARSVNLDVCTSEPYSPESNGMAEAFVKTFKRDYVYVNEVPDALTVLARLPEWFADYNENAPHKGLGMKAPREYIRSLTAG